MSFHYVYLQPIQALEHPKFKELINVASSTQNGVKIPGHKAIHTQIMHMLKDHLMRLKSQFNVHVYTIPPGLFSYHFTGHSR